MDKNIFPIPNQFSGVYEQHVKYAAACALIKKYAGKDADNIIEQVKEEAKSSRFSFLDLLYDKISKLKSPE